MKSDPLFPEIYVKNCNRMKNAADLGGGGGGGYFIDVKIAHACYTNFTTCANFTKCEILV